MGRIRHGEFRIVSQAGRLESGPLGGKWTGVLALIERSQNSCLSWKAVCVVISLEAVGDYDAAFQRQDRVAQVLLKASEGNNR